MMPPAGFVRAITYPESYTLRWTQIIGAGGTINLPLGAALRVDVLFRGQELSKVGPPTPGFILDLVAYCEPATTSAIDTALQFHEDTGVGAYIDLVTWPRTGGTALIVQGYRIPCLDLVYFKLTNSGVAAQTRLCWWATLRNG